MTASALLSTCQSRGILLSAKGDGLRGSAPPCVLEPELLAELQEQKQVLLDLLRPDPHTRDRLARIRATGIWLLQERVARAEQELRTGTDARKKRGEKGHKLTKAKLRRVGKALRDSRRDLELAERGASNPL